MTKKTNPFLYLLPIIAVLTWSGNMIFSKVAVGTISPFSLSFYRWVFALTALTPFVAKKIYQNWDNIKPLLPRIFLLGLFGMVGNNFLIYLSALSTTATNIGILTALNPSFTLLILMLFFNVKPNVPAIIGVGLSLLGIVIILSKGSFELIQHGITIGDFWAFLGMISYVIYGILTRHWQLKLDLLSNVYMQIFFATLIHLPFLLFTPLSIINSQNINIILYTSLLPSIIAPILWTKSIQKIGVTKTSIFVNLVPVFVAIVAVSFLGENWYWYHGLGIILVLFGILLIQTKQ